MAFAFNEFNRVPLVFKFPYNLIKLEKQLTQWQINVIDHCAL